ncbi:acyltransferase family protein [Enterocloster clostridioformis]|uniref:acyltransferase family protein n=1 Tax=Enterocloster clostridioformis TaxID=1531 RepID=UPI00041E044C|nr:acyltransferase family protein [Enterocloster clostridioformis]
MQHKRIHNIDILKGLGVLLVILGHLNLPSGIKSIIYVFHMPLFFFLSGTLWKNKETKMNLNGYIKHMLDSLIYPYVVWNGVEICIHVIKCIIGKETVGLLFKRVIAVIMGVRSVVPYDSQNYLGLLWFFPALFSANVLYFLFRKGKIVVPGIIACTIAGNIYANVVAEKVRLPFCLDVSLLCIWFIWIGEIVGQYGKNVSRIKQFLAIIGVGLCLVFEYFIRIDVDLIRLRISSPLLFYIISSLICVGLYIGTYSMKAKYLEVIGESSAFYLVLQSYGKQLCAVVFLILSKWCTVDFRDCTIVYFISIASVTSLFVFIIKRKCNWMIKRPLKMVLSERGDV